MQRRSKHEMEDEIEKDFKAQKEAQSSGETADKKKQIAQQRKQSTSCRRGGYQKDCRSRKASAKNAQEIIQFERVDFEQVTDKRQLTVCPRTTRISRSTVVYPRRHGTTINSCCGKQRKLVKKSSRDQANSVTAIQEKPVAKIKNKSQTEKNSIEVTNSTIKQTQNISCDH